MTIPTYALITEGAFRRLAALDQIKICVEAQRRFPVIQTVTGNADGRWQMLRRARDLHQQAQQSSPAPSRTGNTTAKPAPRFAAMTPADDIFADFPPYPEGGGPCQCPTCKDSRHD